MPPAQIIGICVGGASLVTSLYVLFRHGFRLDVLWEWYVTTRVDTRITVLETKISSIEQAIWHRGEAEARLKGAIHDRE